MTEQHYLEAARAELEAAGYHPIQEQAVAGRGSASVRDKGPLSVRADLVGWASVNSELRRVVLVEVKAGAIDPERAAPQIRHLANAFGTRDHYIYNGEWHHVDAQSGQVASVAGPVPAPPITPDTVLRRDDAAALVAERVARHLKEIGGAANRRDTGDLLAWAVRASVEAVQDAAVPLTDTSVAWAVLTELTKTADLFGSRNSEWFGMPENLARAMVRLADPADGDTLIDPVCGIGTILWAAQDYARQRERSLTLHGVDVNEHTVHIADAFGRLSPVPIHFDAANLFGPDYPREDESADRVIGIPPMGLRLTQPVRLANGHEIRHDGDIAVVDRMLQLARPGGRVVVQIARSFLSRGGPTRTFRKYLASEMQVQAIIGLPSGLASGTSIPSALLVIDKREHVGETLVAELVDDWSDQLADDGDFMAAFREGAG